MNPAEFQLQGVSDPRLAEHAAGARPVWLWSADGARLLWTNPVGAALFGAANGSDLAARAFGPADMHRRQVAQLANRLPPNGAIRLERLRGFGAQPGMLMTCGCTRLELPDGSHGVLITAAAASGRTMQLDERLRRLVEGIDMPAAAFAQDGSFIGANAAARGLSGLSQLPEAGLDPARSEALATGSAETPGAIGNMVLQRVGSGADVGLVALIAPAAPAEPTPQTGAPEPQAGTPDYEQPASSNEAPAECALIDEFSAPANTAPAQDERCEMESSPDAEASHEPSPYVEAVADEPAETIASRDEKTAPAPLAIPAWLEEMATQERKHPLRFIWHIDGNERFSLCSDDFICLIGPRAAAHFGRPWPDIARTLGLDPEDRVTSAIATHDTWTGITLHWPVDDGEPLPVELSGLPLLDRAQKFAGYRGFGVCRDLAALARLGGLRREELISGTAPASLAVPGDDKVQTDSRHAVAADPPVVADGIPAVSAEPAAPIADEISRKNNLDEAVEAPRNVVPFRPATDGRSPVLTPGENSAFNELARQLSARLERERPGASATPSAPETETYSAGPQAATSAGETPPIEPSTGEAADVGEPSGASPEWLAPPEPPARGKSGRDRMLLDLLPTGILIYRLDRLLYANPAFLERIGYPSLHALEQDGGLDALYVEPGVSTASSTSEAGTPVRIAAAEAHTGPTDARLFTISWDGDSALALMFAPTQAEPAVPASEPPVPVASPPTAGHAEAEDLAAILDTTAEGIAMFDAAGNLHACNRGAEALFGYDGADFIACNLADLFAPESQRAVLEYLESIKQADAASLLDAGREVLGRVKGGGIIPLSMTMGRTRPQGPNFFAVFRDLSQNKKGETELAQARRLAERAGNAKADMLARISHEVRSPLNAIIGFAEVMIGERFGALGNERYVEYLKDIRASGERVIAILNDLTELSRIESGKLDLSFASQNLNELVESCVAVMQPQANRERIIIRTSLAQMLPPVVADARALRQIAMNLIGSSIHLANPGGQVIVSTAFSDLGEVVLRVRDTGHGLNDNEVAAALEPFRAASPSDQAADSSAVNLSLTKALVEANRAQFHIKTGGRSGTLIEVVFARALATA